MNLKQTSFFHSQFKIFGIYALTAFILYAVVLPTPFKSLDDFVSIINNLHIKSLSYIPTLFRDSFFGEGAYYRPFTHLSFLFEFHFFKLNSFYYNLNNILLHVFNTMGVYWLITHLLNNRKIAFYSAFLFVLHPVHWECVGNIAGRSILLSAFFLIYSLLAFLLFYEKRSLSWYLISFLFFAGGLLSKETGVMLIAVLGVYLYLFQNPKRQLWTNVYLWILPYVAFLVFYLYVRARLDIYQHVRWGSLAEMILGVGSFLNACFHYLQAMVFPLDFYFDFSHDLIASFADVRFWVAVLFWGTVIATLFLKRKTLDRVNTFFFMWIGIHFFPVMQFVPVRVTDERILTSDHFLYLPIIGFLVIFVTCMQQWMGRLIYEKKVPKKMWRIIIILYMSYLVVVCFTQNIYATNMFSMYKKALQHNPANYRVRNSIAIAYAMTGRFEEAEEHLKIILKDEPNYVKARVGLAETYNDRGMHWKALDEYAKIHNKEGIEEFYRHGMAYAVNGLKKEYEQKLKEDPNNPELIYTMGVIYAKAEKFEPARDYFEKTLSVMPTHEQALFNMAATYSLEGNWPKAIENFNRVLTNKASKADEEHDEQAYEYLGKIFQYQGNTSKAEEYFAKAQELAIIKDNQGRQK